MGLVYASIELINSADLYMASKKDIGVDEVRRVQTTMLVDSGSFMMAINESIFTMLGLEINEHRPVQLADGSVRHIPVCSAIDVRFANRKATCSAFVLPGTAEPLLGAIPMEEMDVLVHPSRMELIVNPAHPEGALLRL